MSTLLKKMEQLGASASGRELLLKKISQQELEQLMADSPQVCAFDQFFDEQ